MIRKITIKRFKRFDQVEFNLRGHVVLAGPNNCGKTTALQAVAAFSLALQQWKTLNNYHRRGGGYQWKPIARQAFSAVPLRSFDLLWTRREYRDPIEIVIEKETGQWLQMEFNPNSTEQIYFRPKSLHDPAEVQVFDLPATYIPPMSGLETDEPVYQPPKQNDLLGKGKPGDVLRNLLVTAHQQQQAWDRLQSSISRLFGYELLPPDTSGPHIIAEYRADAGTVGLDIASAGSGFQQVLMLLTFLHTRRASTLLLDEPDAHLHVILQDTIYSELRSVAAQWNSQLIVATHSEVIINSVAPEELCIVVGATPRLAESTAERRRLADAMRILTNTDLMVASTAPGVLFTEDYTDLNILREWANVLGHPLAGQLDTRILWKKIGVQQRDGGAGISARDYYDKLTLIRDDLPGVELLDGDANPSIPPTAITGQGLQRLRWTRYEIESYLFHPAALARYVEQQVGPGAAATHIADLQQHLADNYPPRFIANPLEDAQFLIGTKARSHLIPPALDAAGLPAIPYTRFHEIAALMQPEEIHPEVVEKLNAIQQAFNL